MSQSRGSRKPGYASAAAPAASSSPTVTKNYLIAYNLVSAVLWAAVLGRVVLITSMVGYRDLYRGTGDFVRITQTLALLEVAHSVFNIVRAPLLTTAMQVASRLVLVWPILYPFPSLAQSPFYASMLVAWSTTEVIRYSFFVASLSSGSANVPPFLQWLRYNTFFVLYPLGITSECALMYKSIGLATKKWGAVGQVGWGLLAVWALGSYVLYTHMMAQRRKVMRGSRGSEFKQS